MMRINNYLLKFLIPKGLPLLTLIVDFLDNRSSSDRILLSSEEGQRLLARSSNHANYELLNYCFEKQDKFNYCGVASATIVLNALSISAFTLSKSNICSTFTQDSVFRNKIKPTIFFKKIFLGMTLEQLGQLFQAYSLNTKIYYVDKFFNLEKLKHLGKSSLEQNNNFIVVNYGRYCGLSGHISPLGAYDRKTERFLILDVGQKNDSAWIEAERLYQDMQTNDVVSGKSRGFIVVSKNYRP